MEPDDDERDRRLGAAIDGYFEALEHGEQVTIAAWATGYPDMEEELRASLETLVLLRAERKSPASEASPTSSVFELPPPARVPGYRLLEELGRGGMGVVYKAWQSSTKRVVALKFLSSRASPSARRRFEREIELAAALDHPGIVRVLEGGEAEGNLFCAMEYVDGLPLHRYLQEKAPPLAQRLRLFAEIADAVHHAHLSAVVHRDLKPSNVMVDSAGRARILDFGLARLADPERAAAADERRLTREGQLVGTLPYLSPEQASGAGADLRSDVYALGVILYELLTGRLPYEVGGGLREALERICTVTPPRPSRGRPEIRADLDAVVLKALEKSRAARYQSAAALAEDVRAYLRDEPVEAGRASPFYLLRKAYARHRRGLQVAAAILALLVVSSAVVLLLYLRLLDEQSRLRRELQAKELRTAQARLAAGHDLMAESLLGRVRAQADESDPRVRWSLACFAIQNPLRRWVGDSGWTTAMAFAPDGGTLATGNLEGRLALRRAGAALELTPLWEVEAHAGGVRDLAFTPDGATLLGAGADGRIRSWSAADGRPLAEVARAAPLRALHVLGDGPEWVDVDARGEVHLHARGGERLVEPASEQPGASALSAGDRRLALARGREVLVTDLDGAPRATLGAFTAPVEALAFTPDGRALVAWSAAEVSAWDLATSARRWSAPAGLSEPRPTELWAFPPGAAGAPAKAHATWTPRLVFSSDGALLAVTGWDAVVRVLETASGRTMAELRAHETALYSAAFEPGSRVLVAGTVATLRAWDLARHPGIASRELPHGSRPRVALSSGRIAWAPGTDGTVSVARLEDFPAGGALASVRAHDSAVEAVCFDRAGERLATAGEEGELAVWRADTLALLRRWPSGDARPRALAFAPDGLALASGGAGGTLALWDATTGALLASAPAHAGQILALAFSPDGTLVATGGSDWKAELWRVGDGALEHVAQREHLEWVNALAFSPDGGTLATSGADLCIRLGPPAGPLTRTIQGAHAHWVTALAFLEHGQVLASGGYDGALRFWDVASGEELASLPARGGPIESLVAGADERLLVLGATHAVQLVDLAAATVSK